MVINNCEYHELHETQAAQTQAYQGGGGIIVHDAAPQQVQPGGEKGQSVGGTAKAMHEGGNGPQDGLA
jgi:hypothetical protein